MSVHFESAVEAPLSHVRLAIERARTRPVPWPDRVLVLLAGGLRPSEVTMQTEPRSHTVSVLCLEGRWDRGLRLLARRIDRRARRYLVFGVRTGASTAPLRSAASKTAGTQSHRGGLPRIRP